jgi:hypothetical protein
MLTYGWTKIERYVILNIIVEPAVVITLTTIT